MEYIESYRKINHDEIKEAENQLNIKLPSQYIEFLLSANGGIPKRNGFSFYNEVEKENQLGMVNRFLGINNGQHNNFVNYFRTYEKRIPEGMIPIANDPGGNLICLSKTGSVYFWDHNYEVEEDEIPDYRNLFLINNNFQQFIESLRV